MTDQTKMIEVLNTLLKSELTAISQYTVHASMNGIWDINKMDEYTMGRAKDEMKHAEKLIERILFLGGKPIVSTLDAIHIGQTIPEQLDNDHEAETVAIASYNEAIAFALKIKDNGTHELLQDNLEEEEGHILWINGQQAKIEQMGLSNYISTVV